MSVALALPACSVPTVGLAQSTAVTPTSGYQAGDLYLPSSRVYALVGKTGFGHEHGVTGGLKSGRLLLGATQDAGELVFDMTSFTADTDAARRFVRLEGASSESTRQQVTANMLGSDVLNVAKFATARYRIDSAVEELGQGTNTARRYRLTGQLTLQSVTRPLSVLAEVDLKNGWNRVRGSFRLKQTDFGIKPYTKAFGAVGVADEMTVWGEFWVAPSAGLAHQSANTTR
ncbi:YceI family protein [Botrimarina colliarenosi]|uniref:YceI family protein n=1 Tax=Botrimarina colliarenosi TaxID=2528001 RepID=UPI0018D426A1|nr:YceI family protein [Botrimarina colliarenosi]